MIFASQQMTTLIVAAGDSFVEMDNFYKTATSAASKPFINEFQPSITDMMMDERFSGFRKPPYVFEFSDIDDLTKFSNEYNIKIISHKALSDQQKNMIADLTDDPYMSDKENQTLGEIFSLEEFDPWDRRTDEEKAQDREFQKEAEKAKKAGKLSGESFGGMPSKRKKKSTDVTVRVTDIYSTEHTDGSIIIDDVLAVKSDIHEDNGLNNPANMSKPVVDDAQPGEHFYRFDLIGHNCNDLDDWLDLLGELSDTSPMEDRDKLIVSEGVDWFVIRGERVANKICFFLDFNRIAFKAKVVDAKMAVIKKSFKRSDASAQEINPDGWIAIYHRLDVHGVSLSNVISRIKQEESSDKKKLLDSIVAARGQMETYCWLACATKHGAETLEAIFKADSVYASSEMEVYGVNDKGERLVPKGIQIVEETVIVHPRPWNDKADEWNALDAEARNQEDIRIRGSEFIFCGSYRGPGDGCVIYITPRSYFQEHGEMWENDLNLQLPEDFKEISPGVYRTRSRDWVSVCLELSRKGLVESLGLQIHVNNF